MRKKRNLKPRAAEEEDAKPDADFDSAQLRTLFVRLLKRFPRVAANLLLTRQVTTTHELGEPDLTERLDDPALPMPTYSVEGYNVSVGVLDLINTYLPPSRQLFTRVGRDGTVRIELR